MSKMGQIHAELTAKAAELGFQSIEEAEANGYVATYGLDGETKLTKTESELEKAHRDYLERKELYIYGLKRIAEQIDELGLSEQANTLIAIANFMNEGEH